VSALPPIMLTLLTYEDGERREAAVPWLVARPFDATEADEEWGGAIVTLHGWEIDGKEVPMTVKETIEEIANLVDARRLS
jgi:nitrogen fixation protein